LIPHAHHRADEQQGRRPCPKARRASRERVFVSDPRAAQGSVIKGDRTDDSGKPSEREPSANVANQRSTAQRATVQWETTKLKLPDAGCPSMAVERQVTV
jgi:hypothetical protein